MISGTGNRTTFNRCCTFFLRVDRFTRDPTPFGSLGSLLFYSPASQSNSPCHHHYQPPKKTKKNASVSSVMSVVNASGPMTNSPRISWTVSCRHVCSLFLSKISISAHFSLPKQQWSARSLSLFYSLFSSSLLYLPPNSTTICDSRALICRRLRPRS